jgi:ATP-dependent protease HslVU (ClpYQ) peptidase subunit
MQSNAGGKMKKIMHIVLPALFMALAPVLAAKQIIDPQISMSVTQQTTPSVQPTAAPEKSVSGAEKVNIIEIENSKSGSGEGIPAKSPEASPAESAQPTATPEKAVETPVESKTAADGGGSQGGIVLMAGTKEKMIRNDYVLIERSGFISDDFTKDGIVYNLEGRASMQQGMYCYVKMDAGKDVKPGVEFLAYSDEEGVSDPSTGENLGRLININGVGKIIEKSAEGVWKVRIEKNYNILYNNSKIKLRDAFRDYFDKVASTVKMGTGQIRGLIILRQNGYSNGIKIKDIVYINKGFRDGLRPGDRLSVIKISPENDSGTGGDYNSIGSALVLNVMDKSSTAVITGNTDVIQVGDTVKTIKK